MGDGEIGGTKNGTTAIKQSSRVIYGGPGGAPTRDLRRAKPLFSRLNYWPVSVYIQYTGMETGTQPGNTVSIISAQLVG